jgi:hypothetical protein
MFRKKGSKKRSKEKDKARVGSIRGTRKRGGPGRGPSVQRGRERRSTPGKYHLAAETRGSLGARRRWRMSGYRTSEPSLVGPLASHFQDAAPARRSASRRRVRAGVPLFSATAGCTPRVSRRTSEHACVNSRRSPSHQRCDRLERWVAVAMAVLGHVRRDDPRSSPGLQWLHGICPVETRRGVRRHTPPPSFATLQGFPKPHVEKTAGRGTRVRRTGCLPGDLGPDDRG